MASGDQFRTIRTTGFETAAPPDPPRVGLFALVIVATVGVGAAVAFAAHAWLAPPEISPAVLSATSPRGPAEPQLSRDDGSWTDADIRACKGEATAAADAAAGRKLIAVSADRVGLGAPDVAIVEHAAHLLCTARSKPLHLCAGYWRNDFVHAIKSYAAEFQSVSASAYWTKFNIAERARKSAPETRVAWQAASEGLDQTTREVARMHEEIVAAFRGLIAEGIISASDFGVFLGVGIPSEIKAMIGEAKPAGQACG